MKRALLLISSGLVLATPAFGQIAGPGSQDAQGATVASQPIPDTAMPSPGVAGADAVNPAPGARGPYVGDGPANFYDVDARIAAVGRKIASLPSPQRRQAAAALASIRSEEATQRQRHGDLRDWDRENLNHRLDQLAQRFPALQVGAPTPLASR